jgi:isopentenyldiphosphate isomerase
MELIDILDAQGNKTGRVKLKAEVHRDGDWHRAVHVWFLGPGDQVLMQRRSKHKENNPGKWDVSVAGHLSAGEESVQAALREIKEEIGLILAPDALSYQFTVTEEQILNNGRYIDREFHDVYFARKEVDLAALSFNDGEVDEVRHIALRDLQRWVEEGGADLVPHPDEYAMFFQKTILASTV